MVIELLPKVEHNTCGREEDMDAGTAAYQETDPVELQGLTVAGQPIDRSFRSPRVGE